MKNFRRPVLYCFSPPVMILTFAIEIILAAHTIWKYTFSRVTRLAVAALVCLAVFQFAEYFVCEPVGMVDSTVWAKMGYVAITLLPPLGLHLIAAISGDARRWIYYGGYALSSIFIGFFLLVAQGVTAGACVGNYVIFEQNPDMTIWYALYYYGLLLAAIGYALQMAGQKAPHIAVSLRVLTVGYAGFIVPTTLVNLIDPETIRGIPSIMCGFAIILAVVIAVWVLPMYHRKK